MAGSAATDHQRAIAAVLDARPPAVLSHASAAGHWRLPGFRIIPFEVTVARPSRTTCSSLARLHSTTHLPESHITVVDGLPVTVPVRTLFDLAGRLHPDRVGRLIDAAWRMRLVTGRLLRRTLAELAEHGRAGIVVMREHIELRGDGYRPPESNLEHRFEELMIAVGIRTLERQVDLGADDWLGRVDFRDRTAPLVIEIDSATFHSSLTDKANDARRRAGLERLGFSVLVFSDEDVWHRPDWVKTQVRTRRRELATAPTPAPTTFLSLQRPL